MRKKNITFDMVILDMAMPGMGSSETFDRLVKVNPNIKVLISSGCSLHGEFVEVLERGCIAFIQKPFKMRIISKSQRCNEFELRASAKKLRKVFLAATSSLPGFPGAGEDMLGAWPPVPGGSV